MKPRHNPGLSLTFFFLIFCFGCHNTNKSNQKMKQYFESAEEVTIPGLRPELESDPNIYSFEKWLQKESELSFPGKLSNFLTS
ncbi:MAG: hypothetical protein JWN76_437 [Chitinophagaceae bacterium]|nr:hypothetical protein [Chitinophagaceae bacterium]